MVAKCGNVECMKQSIPIFTLSTSFERCLRYLLFIKSERNQAIN